MQRRHIAFFGVLLLAVINAKAQDIGPLEIHYINVGQGGSTLIIGPDGTTVLYDFGNIGRGHNIATYLEHKLGIAPSAGIDFSIVSHRDSDHYGGYVEVTDAGYDINIANFGSGSKKTPTARMEENWLTPAGRTTAGDVIPIPVGLRLPLGDGAELRVVASNGRVFNTRESLGYARNENDRSVFLYLKYKNFDYVLDGDLGAGPEECTSRDTSQRSFQAPAARMLEELGMDPELGIDVMHISHHGSESSTSAEYYNLLKPEVGLISVGLNQRNFLHPRVDVVEGVLIGDRRADCVEAPPLQALFQTDIGKPGSSSTGATSFLGMPVGDIKLTTDGVSDYRITGSGRTEEPNTACVPITGDAWVFPLDELQTPAPTKSTNQQCLDYPAECECELNLARANDIGLSPDN